MNDMMNMKLGGDLLSGYDEEKEYIFNPPDAFDFDGIKGSF